MTNFEENLALQFYYLSKSDLRVALEFANASYEEEIDVQAVRNVEDPGKGVQYEFMLRWYEVRGKLAMRVEVFEGAFRVFDDFPEFWAQISRWHETQPQPDRVAASLSHELGLQDVTEYPDGNVPYVHREEFG